MINLDIDLFDTHVKSWYIPVFYPVNFNSQSDQFDLLYFKSCDSLFGKLSDGALWDSYFLTSVCQACQASTQNT